MTKNLETIQFPPRYQVHPDLAGRQGIVVEQERKELRQKFVDLIPWYGRLPSNMAIWTAKVFDPRKREYAPLFDLVHHPQSQFRQVASTQLSTLFKDWMRPSHFDTYMSLVNTRLAAIEKHAAHEFGLQFLSSLNWFCKRDTWLDGKPLAENLHDLVSQDAEYWDHFARQTGLTIESVR